MKRPVCQSEKFCRRSEVKRTKIFDNISEMYKCLHEFSMKTVPDASLHETSDLI